MNTSVQSHKISLAKRVLIIVPDESIIAAARELCAEVGIELVTCDSTAQAIEILKRQTIDLIAPEAFMVNDNLFAFIAQVRTLPAHFHTPIWVIARNPGPRGIRLASFVEKAVMLAGADYFTIVHPEDVPRLIGECIRLFNSQRRIVC
jgi:PleD family two-component response regulator